MILAELRDGHSVFVDANIFIYHFGGHSPQCKALLERCARREVQGYTSTPVLAEVLHRLMVAEAITKGLVSAKTAVRKLGETPALVKQLTQYQDHANKIPLMNITILALTSEIVQTSATVRQGEGLLTNDSLVVACMRTHGLKKLATANGDFDHINDLEVYKPTDLKES
ncbi:MAG: PIN domain-containing protein [Deltaproteobacteria bacterium]|nr:PIN domain-containing protein [Deltaproteobacteria bacterium]